MKVRISNYQAIRSANLEFEPGLTAIVGESNNGKSSIIRAIDSAINNKGGDSFISYDSDDCEVVIEDKGNVIKWFKSKKQGKSFYDINGKVLSKIGQKQVDEVAEVLRMPQIPVNNERFKINFWKQLDYPFLVGKTSYQLFDFISNSSDQEIMFGIRDEAEKDLKRYKEEEVTIGAGIDTKTADIVKAEATVKKLEPVNEFSLDILNKLTNIREEISSKIGAYGEYCRRLEKAIKSLDKLPQAIESLEKYYNNIGKLYGSKKTLGSAISKYGDVVSKIRSVEKRINMTDVEISGVEEGLAKFKVCPFCGSSLQEV